MKKENIETIKGLTLFTIFIIIFFSGAIYIIDGEIKAWPIITTITLGLLGFLGIFFPLVIQKDIIKKQEGMLNLNWKRNIKDFKANLNFLQNELKKKKPSYELMGKFTEKMHIILEAIAGFQEEINLKGNLFLGLIILFCSLILGFFGSIINSEIYTFYTVLAYLLLLIGLFPIFRIISIWRKI